MLALPDGESDNRCRAPLDEDFLVYPSIESPSVGAGASLKETCAPRVIGPKTADDLCQRQLVGRF